MKLRIEIDSELTETEIVIKAAALTDEIADLQRLLQETKAPRLIFYKGTGEYYLDKIIRASCSTCQPSR